jgi:hypothetical protein
MSQKTLASLTLPAALTLAIPTSAGAAVVSDDFDTNRYGWNAVDGVGTWLRVPNNDYTNAYITESNPVVSGGGRYVRVVNQANTTTEPLGPPASGGYGIRKRFDSAVLNTTLPHTVSFDFRVDTPLTTFTEFADRFHIAASTDTNFTNTNNTSTWTVGVVGASTANNGTAGYWYFYDRTVSEAFTPANMYITSLRLEQGVTYSFVINVNPATASYSATITSSTGATSTASNLGFRNNTVGAMGDLLLFGGNTSASGEMLGFSADNIIIVPEPGSALLVLVGSCSLAIRRRRA